MKDKKFPKGFWWGTATAGHQVEGGNEHSDWWAWEKKGLVREGHVSGRACDYWHRWREDHQLMKDFGHTCFRLGLEWARIEPRDGQFDEKALGQYREMLEDLQSKGIRVCLTLNHWVVPQWFRAMGGFENKKALAYWERFVKKVVPALAPCVDLWVTLNEPMVPIIAGYIAGYFPPQKINPLAAATVFRALLRAHAIAYRVIHAEVSKAAGGGPVMAGFASAIQHFEPWDHDNSAGSLLQRAAARFLTQASYACWDDSVVSGQAALPFGQGQEIPDLKGSVDYVGVNYYTRISVRLNLATVSNVMTEGYDIPEGIEATDMGWQIFPPGFYHVLRAQHTRYGKPIYITENGCGDAGDDMRRRYLLTHIAQVHRAIQDGVDIRGYFHWTFCDNFEWREGYTKKLGLFALDHNDPDLKRVPRESAHMFREIAKHNGITQKIEDTYGPGCLEKWENAVGFV